MKKNSTIFLQAVVVLIGIGVLFLLLLEPRLEGVNAGATTFAQIYLDDPFLALVYVGSIPFFMALYQAFKLLGYVGQNKVFSQAAAQALRKIRYCAVAIIGFVAVEEVFIMLTHGNDDATGGFMMGVFIIVGSIVVAAASTMLEGVVQKGIIHTN